MNLQRALTTRRPWLSRAPPPHPGPIGEVSIPEAPPPPDLSSAQGSSSLIVIPQRPRALPHGDKNTRAPCEHGGRRPRTHGAARTNRHRIGPWTPCSRCLLRPTRGVDIACSRGCDSRMGDVADQEDRKRWAPAAQESGRRRACCAMRRDLAAWSTGRGPQPQATGPASRFRRAPSGPAPAKTSHQAHCHGHPSPMFGQGATPLMDPVMRERPPPPPNEVRRPSNVLRILRTTIHTMTRRNVTYPHHHHALWPRTLFQQGLHGPC